MVQVSLNPPNPLLTFLTALTSCTDWRSTTAWFQINRQTSSQVLLQPFPLWEQPKQSCSSFLVGPFTVQPQPLSLMLAAFGFFPCGPRCPKCGATVHRSPSDQSVHMLLMIVLTCTDKTIMQSKPPQECAQSANVHEAHLWLCATLLFISFWVNNGNAVESLSCPLRWAVHRLAQLTSLRWDSPTLSSNTYTIFFSPAPSVPFLLNRLLLDILISWHSCVDSRGSCPCLWRSPLLSIFSQICFQQMSPVNVLGSDVCTQIPRL